MKQHTYLTHTSAISSIVDDLRFDMKRLEDMLENNQPLITDLLGALRPFYVQDLELNFTVTELVFTIGASQLAHGVTYASLLEFQRTVESALSYHGYATPTAVVGLKQMIGSTRMPYLALILRIQPPKPQYTPAIMLRFNFNFIDGGHPAFEVKYHDYNLETTVWEIKPKNYV